MSHSWLRRALVPATAALALVLAGCGGSSGGGGGSSPSTYEFGAMVPLSGTDSALGTEAQQAIGLALSEINSSGDLGKTKLKAIYRDNPGTPETAVTNFQKLTSINHVSFSFTTFSSATKAIAPLATSGKVVLLNPGASSSELKSLSPYVFSDIPLGDAQAKAMLTYARKVLHIKRLSGLYSNDAQGTGFKNFIPDYWRSLGGSYVGDATVSTTQSDFTSVLSTIKNQHPDAVYLGFFGSGQGNVLKQAAQIKLKTTWLGSTSFANQGALQIAGPNAEGVYSTQVQPADTAAAKKFVSDYQSKYGAYPTSFAQLFYSGAQVLGKAVKAVLDKHQELNGDNIKSAFLSGTFDTANGSMDFQPDGTVKIPIAITDYRDKAFKQVATYDNGNLTKAGQ